LKKTLLDMSLVLFIVISLSLSVVASDALLGDTDWNIGIGTTNERLKERNLALEARVPEIESELAILAASKR